MKLINNKINLKKIKVMYNHFMILILILNILINHKLHIIMIKLRILILIYLTQKRKLMLIKYILENHLMIL